jgi:UDP-GlcNAc:undecaprenyl-phosphate GlcNAc-1-phosphate transferase
MAPLIFSALLTFLLAALQIRLNPRLGLSVAPRQDRWHKLPTPSSGGIAVFCAVASAYCIWYRGQHQAIAIAAAAVWVLGLVDDVLRLPPGIKLAVQCVISFAVVASGVVFHATSSPLFNFIFSCVWLVGITNAFNLIDNMDGLCAGVVIIIAVFRFILLASIGAWNDANLYAIIGAAFAGFLMWNRQPARIFMGDCGSMLAGFSLAALTIASPLPHTKAFLAAVFYPALTFTYPIFDTTLVSVLRKLAGRPISLGGKDHSSHRLVAAGLSESRVVCVLWALTGLGCGIGFLVHSKPFVVVAAGGLLWLGLAVFGIFLANFPPFARSFCTSGSRKAEHQDIQEKRFNYS